MTAIIVKGIDMPSSDNAFPSKPCLPKAINMATPATTGGNKIGSSTSVSISFKNPELLRASRWANGVQTITITNMLAPLVTSETLIA